MNNRVFFFILQVFSLRILLVNRFLMRFNTQELQDSENEKTAKLQQKSLS